MCGINSCITADVYNSTTWDIIQNDSKPNREFRGLREFPFSISSNPHNSIGYKLKQLNSVSIAPNLFILLITPQGQSSKSWEVKN